MYQSAQGAQKGLKAAKKVVQGGFVFFVFLDFKWETKRKNISFDQIKNKFAHFGGLN